MPVCPGLCYRFVESLSLLLKFVKNYVFITPGGPSQTVGKFLPESLWRLVMDERSMLHKLITAGPEW